MGSKYQVELERVHVVRVVMEIEAEDVCEASEKAWRLVEQQPDDIGWFDFCEDHRTHKVERLK